METILNLINRIDETIRTAGMLTEEEDRAFREQIEQRISAIVREAEESDLHWAETWFRPAEAELLRSYLRRAVSSRAAMTAPVYNHLLIGTEPLLLKQAQDFAKRFAGLAARFFDEDETFFVCVMTEQQLLSCKNGDLLNTLPPEPERCRILLVPDFRAEDPERLLEVLDDPRSGLGIGRYSVILCGEEAAAEKIREYAGKDFRLGRYVLGKTHHFGLFTERDVHEHTCQQLALSGFAVTDEFRDRLELYIKAVYPEAVFRGKQFVNDLLIRIADARADRLCFGKTLTAADVPYSRKAELLGEADHTEPPDRPIQEETIPTEAAAEAAAQAEPAVPEEAVTAEPVVREEASEPERPAGELEMVESAPPEENADALQGETAKVENNEPIELTEEEYARLTIQWDGAAEWLQKRDQNIKPHAPNILLLALSTFPRENRLEATEFTDDEGVSFTGRYQLDPVPKKISFDLAKEGSAIDYVIMLCTKETERICDVTLKETDKKTYLIKQTSAIRLFSEQLRYYLNPSSNEAVRIIRLYREEGNNEEDFATGFRNAVETIRTLISANAEAAGKPALYMDIHGGFRDSQMVFQSIVSLLETDPVDFDINVYSVKFGDKKRGEKSRIVRSDESLAMYQFASGIREVINYGRTQSLEDYLQNNYPHDQTAHKALAILKKIATGIAWCDIKKFEKGIEELSSFDWGENDGNSGESKLFLTLFRENIERGYEEILKQKAITEEIRWCLRKGFYQQALALIEAKIPEWFVASHAFVPDPGATDRQNNKISPVLQFNACVYYAGTCGTILPAQIKRYFKNSKKCIDETDYQFHLKGLPELKNSEELFSKVKTEASSKEMAPGSKLNTDFDSRIPAHEMVVFLMLHHVFKDLRNDSMHVKNFEYNVDQVKTAIRYYLDLFDGIRESIQTGVFPLQGKKLNVGDVCLATVNKDQTSEYLLTLQDGSIGHLAKEDAISLPKGQRSNPVKERIKVRITSAGNLIKTCTMKDVPQNNRLVN